MATRANDTHDHLFNVVMVGNCGAGKTSIMDRFVNDKYDKEYISTIGVDFKNKIIQVEGKKINLKIWDTSGQANYKSLIGYYYRTAHGIITVVGFQKFDDNNKLVDETVKEFKDRVKLEIDTWCSEAKMHVLSGASRFLVLSHADEFAKKFPNASLRSAIQQELFEYAQQKAQQLEIQSFTNQLFLVSAKSGEGINELFAKAGQIILAKVNAHPELYQLSIATSGNTQGSAKPMDKGKKQASTMGEIFKKNKHHLLAVLLLMVITAAVVLTVLFPPMGLAAMIPSMAAAVGLGGVSTALLAVMAGAATLAISAMVYGLLYFACGSDSVKGKSAKSADDREQLLNKDASASAVSTAHRAAEVVGPSAAYQGVLTPAALPVTNVGGADLPASGQTPTL